MNYINEKELWKKSFLVFACRDIKFELFKPTILSIWFENDAEAEKIFMLQEILCSQYGASNTGPARINTGEVNFFSFCFENKENLEKARQDFGFPKDFVIWQ